MCTKCAYLDLHLITDNKELKLAHSLFEPAPTPLGEKLWRRVKQFNIGLPVRMSEPQGSIEHTDPALLKQAGQLDAHGRQQLLHAILTAKPITK